MDPIFGHRVYGPPVASDGFLVFGLALLVRVDDNWSGVGFFLLATEGFMGGAKVLEDIKPIGEMSLDDVREAREKMAEIITGILRSYDTEFLAWMSYHVSGGDIVEWCRENGGDRAVVMVETMTRALAAEGMVRECLRRREAELTAVGAA